MKLSAKKVLSVFTAALIFTAALAIPAYANSNTMLRLTSSQIMEVDETNSTQINYYTDARKTTKVGSVQVKLSNSLEYLTPVLDEITAVYDLGNSDSANVNVELHPEANYRAPDDYTFGGNKMPLSATQFNLSLAGGIANTLSFAFAENNGGNQPGPGDGDVPGPMAQYPIVAYFDEPDYGVTMNESGSIVIPDGWDAGTVTFKAKIFTKGSVVEPYTGQTSGGTVSEIPVKIEGIANGEEIGNTVIGSVDRSSITIQEGFSDYGKLQLHIVSAEETAAQINQLVKVVHKDLINIKADAPMAMSQSFGTVAVNQAIITKDEVKNVKVFFGNTETTLVVSGPSVDKITAVEGGVRSVLNSDGSATVTLPGLSTETTTPLRITILKKDGTSITRMVNIVRTAIQLQHNNGDGNDTVYAGYVVNKGYLYNNQAHNDGVFNAYLQIIFYKDNAVVGYKQIEIYDEALVNNLQENESGSLELYSDDKIPVYGKEAGGLIDGVNRVSVFLTNGPVDFNGDTLPSVAFGIGSGVTCTWEA